jgi:aldose 1-epimerase
MTIQPHVIANDHWQAGILPETGASIAFGRVRQGGDWLDVLRPTPEADYANASRCASFIMLPWCNRIKEGKLAVGSRVYQLETTPDDGTARHGDARRRAWRVVEAEETHIRMALRSIDYTGVNFPFKFSATAEYALDGRDFIWWLALTNDDHESMPCGFGHHPYFVRASKTELLIPCEQEYALVNHMAVAPPVAVTPRLDFRAWRALDDATYNDVLTGSSGGAVELRLDGLALALHADPIFKHWLLFAPAAEPFVAVEPMTHVSDGFNLWHQGIDAAGVIVLAPGETASGEVIVRLEG